jgi:hypothetical protein
MTLAMAPTALPRRRPYALSLAAFPRLVPLFWLLGVDVAAPFLLVALPVLRGRTLPAGSATPFVAFGFALCAGLIVSLLLGGVGSADRVLSSLYSLLLLGACLWLYAVVHRRMLRDPALLAAFAASMHRLFCFCLVFITVTVPLALLTHHYRLQVPTLLGLLVHAPLPGIAEHSRHAVLSQPDWGLGNMALPRVFLFSPWYTAGALTLYLCGLFAMVSAVLAGRSRRHELLLEALLFIAILATLTRTVLAIHLIAFIASSVLFPDRRRLLLSLLGLALAAIALLSGDLLARALEFRAYSTDARLESYLIGFAEAWQRNPLLGLGYKPDIAGLDIPAGSHSSFTSLFVRGGLVALVLFGLFYYLAPIRLWLRARHRITHKPNRRLYALLFRVQLGAWAWVVFQEFDTAAIASVLLFFSLALCHGALATAQTASSCIGSHDRYNG